MLTTSQALFAYHIEALVPSSAHGAHTSQVPQKLSGTKDVHFFSVGTLQGRTLIIYMKKKSVRSFVTLSWLALTCISLVEQHFPCA